MGPASKVSLIADMASAAPSLFCRDGRQYARGTNARGGLSRTTRVGARRPCSLDLRKRIVGAARLSFEIGALLNGKALVEDVAFDMRRSLKRNAQAFDRSDQVAAHNDVLGHDPAPHLRFVAEQKRAAADVALNFAIDLDLAFGGDVAGDRQVLADNRRDHLAPTRAGTFGSESCWHGRLRIANAFNQFSYTRARLGLCREHHGYLLITN